MSNEVFINYWIAQESTPALPDLSQMPAYVNIAPIAFVGITDDYTLNMDSLNLFPDLPSWIQTVQANGTKVLFSIESAKLGSIPADQVDAFVANVVQTVADWNIDGLDFDFEPPAPTDTLVPLIQQLRNALPAGMIFTTPVYSAWLNSTMEALLTQLAGVVDYVTTMDYSPYPGYNGTISNCQQYAQAMGGWSKLVIGMSCQGPAKSQNFTPLADVIKLSAYEPSATETKGGAMLYTFNYDVTTRPGGKIYPIAGTGKPDGTWTATINANLP